MGKQGYAKIIPVGGCAETKTEDGRDAKENIKLACLIGFVHT